MPFIGCDSRDYYTFTSLQNHILRIEKWSTLLQLVKLLERQIEDDKERRFLTSFVMVWQGVSIQMITCIWRLQDVEKYHHPGQLARQLMIMIMIMLAIKGISDSNLFPLTDDVTTANKRSVSLSCSCFQFFRY